jgi:hypothetical protein
MALSDVLKQGNKLGMFNYGQPQTSFAINVETIPGFSSFSKEDQNSLRKRAIESQFKTAENQQFLAPFMQPYKLQEVEEFREREARRAQELGKESVREAFKYSMLESIPKTISQAFGSSVAMKLLAGQSMLEGGKNILNAYANMQLPTSPMYQSQKYFG